MPLTQIIGWRGSGKTLIATLIAKKQKLKFGDRKIYGNYDIKLNDFKKIDLKDILYLPQNVELILDEAYNLIHSRLSMSYINIYMGFICFEIRKTDTNIYNTSLQLRTIDVLYREEWDYRIYCERIPNYYENWHYWDFLFEIHDRRKQAVKQKILPYYKALKYFPLYDTKEIIEPRFKSRVEYEFLSPRQRVERAKDIFKKIENQLKGDTKYEIEYILNSNDFDKIWTNQVYLELKHKNLN